MSEQFTPEHDLHEDPLPIRLLSWLNKLLQTEYTEVEQLSDGVAYAQVLDAASGQKFQLEDLFFDVGTEEECAYNLQLVQRYLEDRGINKAVPMEILAAGNYEAHCDFLQWCYEYLMTTGSPEAVNSYPGRERRLQAMDLAEARAGADLSLEEATDLDRAAELARHRDQKVPEPSAAVQTMHEKDLPLPLPLPLPRDESFDADASMATSSTAGGGGGRMGELEDLVVSLEMELTNRIFAQQTLIGEIASLRKERDGHFDLLRSIERACELLPDGGSGDVDAQNLLSIVHCDVPDFADASAATAF